VHVLKQIFHPLVMRGVPVIVTQPGYGRSCVAGIGDGVCGDEDFVHQRSGALCERVGADAVNLALALGLDKKIAPRCLQPGAGMGGVFCGVRYGFAGAVAQANGVSLKVLSAARDVNP